MNTEHWPEKLLLIALIMSGLCVMGCLAWVGYASGNYACVLAMQP